MAFMVDFPILTENSDFLRVKYFKIPISLRKHFFIYQIKLATLEKTFKMRHFSGIFQHYEIATVDGHSNV